MALGETNKSAVSSYIPRTERLGCVQDDGVYLKTGMAELDLAAGKGCRIAAFSFGVPVESSEIDEEILVLL
jgi:hypothetical protein